MTKCRGCGAEMKWIKTQKGKSHPLDAVPEKRWVQFKDMWFLVDTYSSHFSTCPDSAKFSRKKGK